MQQSTVQYSTVQYSTVQYSAVQYITYFDKIKYMISARLLSVLMFLSMRKASHDKTKIASNS